MNISKKAALAAAVLLLGTVGLTACSVPTAEASKPKAEPTHAQPVDAPSEEPETNPGTLAFGDAMTWEDNVSISVSAPTEFTPTEYAAGTEQAHQVVFSVVLKNDSSKPLKPMVITTVSSGGAESSPIFDTGNAVGDIGGAPMTTILPGQSVTWLEAYSVADIASLTFEVSPSFEYENAIFTNIK